MIYLCLYNKNKENEIARIVRKNSKNFEITQHSLSLKNAKVKRKKWERQN